MTRSPVFLPLAVFVTCIPCLLIPLAAALMAAGAFSGVLGLLGIPWVLAIVAAVPMAVALIALHSRRHGAECVADRGERAQPTP
ncbi:MAG: hypothetical protein AB7J35_05435 [Dehalococcoidia bacterium]